MSKPSLLDIVQEVLNDMSGDFVNSIDDTEEAQQVASIVRSTYRAIISNRNWPHTARVVNLEAYTDGGRPTHMRLSEDAKKVISIYYDIRKPGSTSPDFKEMRWKEPDDFLRFVYNRSADNSNTIVVEDPSGVQLLIVNNKPPEYYTSFDDQTIVFDSYDSRVDDTLQAHKTLTRAYVTPPFYMRNDFVPDLPEEAFAALIEETKSRASAKLDQEPDVKSEQESRRQQRWLSRQAWRVNGGVRYPDYGRKRNRYRRSDPTFRRG